MNRYVSLLLTIVFMLISVSTIASQPSGAAYLGSNGSNIGLILAHGRGKHPTWKVVEPLRKGVNEKLGFHTLSLQMPNGDKKWKKYADDFPAAYDMIKEGIRYLREEKGVTEIYLMGHSMGSRMASAFVSENPDQPITGLIIAGCRNNGGYPLSCDQNLENVDIPVLDIWGDGSDKDADAASKREALVSEKYKQVKISGANHKFEGYENEFVTSVVEWLKIRR